MKEKNVKPFIKWAGGKQQLLPELLRLIPVEYGKYIEPFFGGGALFFALKPERSILSDVNSDLINLYTTVRDNPASLINSVSKLKSDKDSYYRIRAKKLDRLTDLQCASRFLYLNKTCYNGLYRVNRKGEFNVPFADYKNRKIYDIELIYRCSDALKKSSIKTMDYKDSVLSNAKKGDLVFLDPPYLPVSKNSSFNRYNPNPFDEQDHVDLAEIFWKLDSIGCHVILTNSDHPLGNIRLS